MNKKSLCIAALTALTYLPFVAHAQSVDNGPVTRAEVHAQMVQLENAGYDRFDDRINYPQDVQAAEAKLAAGKVAAAPAHASQNTAMQPSAAHDALQTAQTQPSIQQAWPITTGGS